MCITDKKFKIKGKVQSISVGDGKIVVKLSPNYEEEYLLLEIEKCDTMMRKCNADKTCFYIKNCQIANIVTTHLREQMTFNIEEEGKNYVIVGVELIYG